MAIGLVSLALLPFIPVLPGMGSLLAVALGLLALRQATRLWMPVVAVVTGGLGLALALAQTLSAVLAVWEVM